MKLPRDIDGARLVKALDRLGYRVIRQSGSHIRLQCDEPSHAITVPDSRCLVGHPVGHSGPSRDR
jgi:predicted RNA binding protein YcfA (HicA-like mRNA interferase family)